MARKLKGKLSNKLKSEQKEKMENTLKRMDAVREQDNVTLRNILVSKLAHYKEELKKAQSYIEDFENKIENMKNTKIKLEGAIIAINEILNNDIKDKSES